MVCSAKSAVRGTLVIGGGVAGAAVARQLGQAGVAVHLVEMGAAIGGWAAQMGCKATDVCLKCNVCVANEMLRGVLAEPNVTIHTDASVTGVNDGTNGSRYTAILNCGAKYIDPAKCVGCGLCVGLGPRSSVAVVQPAISSQPVVVDEEAWLAASEGEREKCAKACPVGAINIKAKKTTKKVDVDAVVVATGYEPYDPVENSSYRFEQLKNLITGMEAEKQLEGKGQILRPSDGKRPKRIAFVQCVGSRTEEIHRRYEQNDYCSAVCCAYALRMAQKMQFEGEKASNGDAAEKADITVFYMDIQNFGKGFEAFYKECKEKMMFVRSRPYEMVAGADDKVIVKYAKGAEDDKTVCQGEFDLVVLAVGIRPGKYAGQLADKLRVPVDQYGFCGQKGADGLADMQREGFYAVGTAEGPKDIAGSIAQAQAVSAAVLRGKSCASCCNDDNSP